MNGDNEEQMRLLRMAGAFDRANKKGRESDLRGLVMGDAVVRDADGDAATYMGIDVMYAGRVPLPIVYVSWEEETLAKVYGPTQFSMMQELGKNYADGKPIRKLKYHDMKTVIGYSAWHVPGMMARFSYRDTDTDETLRMGIDAPQWYKAGMALDASGKFLPEDFNPNHPYKYVYGAKMQGWSAKLWFNFKAAYQQCGYYLVRYGVYNEFGNDRWMVDLSVKVPFFVCYDIDFSEIGDITRLTWASEDGKSNIKGAQKR